MNAQINVSKELYPFEGNYLKVGEHQYHYLDEGEGHPVVMVHGNPSWSFYYRNLAQVLRSTHRVIVPDHIGMGLSDKPSDDAYGYHLEQRVDDLDALLTHLKLDSKITLVVHDWGGMIGMAYATRYPERIARIVILNTGAFHLPQTKALPWQLKLARDSSIGGFLVRGFNAFSRGATIVGCTRNPMPKNIVKAYTAPYNTWSNRIATLRFVQDIPLVPEDKGYDLVTNVEKQLSQFAKLPVLICWGDKDFVFDHHFLKQWQGHLPDAEVHRFPDCGHYILEDATDEVITLIQDFLERHPIAD